MNKSNYAPIADRRLWDSLGNYCRIEMYPFGADTFEVFNPEAYIP